MGCTQAVHVHASRIAEVESPFGPARRRGPSEPAFHE